MCNWASYFYDILYIMKKPIIIGNWKTNPATLSEAKKNILAIDKKLKTLSASLKIKNKLPALQWN